MPNLQWYIENVPDYQEAVASEGDIVVRKNGSGSAINKGAPCCLLVTSFDGFTATIPAANNMALFEGVWLGAVINGALANIPNGSYGLVQKHGWVLDPQDVGAARVLGSAGISSAGMFLKYTAGNDYFELFSDLYSDLEEQASKVLSGEAWTTASTALKKVWLKG